ncbi:CAAX amino terminal protease self- immunity [compost metagenome]
MLWVVPVTLVAFFATAVLWGILGPLLIPALRGNERLISLTGFFPIELVGVLVPALLACKIGKVDFRATFPFRPVAWWRLLLIVGATFGLALVITYLQGWFAQATGLPYPKDVTDLIRAHNPTQWAFMLLAVAFVPAFAEEMVTRGYIQSALVPRLGLVWGILLTAGIFALMHFLPAGIPTYVILGIWLSVVRHRTGSMIGAIAAHATNNTLALMQANLVPEAYWATNIAWVLPLGVVLFGTLGYLSLKDLK